MPEKKNEELNAPEGFVGSGVIGGISYLVQNYGNEMKNTALAKITNILKYYDIATKGGVPSSLLSPVVESQIAGPKQDYYTGSLVEFLGTAGIVASLFCGGFCVAYYLWGESKKGSRASKTPTGVV